MPNQEGINKNKLTIAFFPFFPPSILLIIVTPMSFLRINMVSEVSDNYAWMDKKFMGPDP